MNIEESEMENRRLVKLTIRNFRSIEEMEIEPRTLNVLCGPNGSGKSTFLDALWFMRDCLKRGVDQASADRSHGIGVLWESADETAGITIEVETLSALYRMAFGFSSGRIEPFIGETLISKIRNISIIERKAGSEIVRLYSSKLSDHVVSVLREPEKPSLERQLALDQDLEEVNEVDKLLHFVNMFRSRDFRFYSLQKYGSEISHETRLWSPSAQNLWSVLRNIKDKRESPKDDRYDTIMDFMKEAFPSFKGLELEQTGPSSIYCSFYDSRRTKPIHASGVADGQIQLLILLTALFSEGRDRGAILLFDEPETSLHPKAIHVFGEATKLASQEWSKQIFIATHSPTLLNENESTDIWSFRLDSDGRTKVEAASENQEIEDLLNDYNVGTLYMHEVIAPQNS